MLVLTPLDYWFLNRELVNMKKYLFLLLFFLFIPNAHAINYCTNGFMGAAYKFDASSGTEPDCTPNANTATGTSVTEGITGKYNLAVNFLNTNSTRQSASAAASINTLSTVSLGAWIKPNSAGQSGNKCSGATIIGKTDASHGPELCINTDGSFEFEANWSGGGTVWKTTTTPIVTGSWQHVAVTYSYSSTANTPIFYYNGVVQTNTRLTGAPFGSQGSDSSNGLSIGNETSGGGTGGGFDGGIDEPFIANVVLSSTDIANIYGHALDGSFNNGTVSILKAATLYDANNF